MIGEVVVLRTGHGVRQLRKPELDEAGQELLQMLAPEGAEDQLRRVGAAPPAHRGENEPGEEAMIEHFDSPISPGDRVVHGDILRRLPVCDGRRIHAFLAVDRCAMLCRFHLDWRST
jgi:hypothetical protein